MPIPAAGSHPLGRAVGGVGCRVTRNCSTVRSLVLARVALQGNRRVLDSAQTTRQSEPLLSTCMIRLCRVRQFATAADARPVRAAGIRASVARSGPMRSGRRSRRLAGQPESRFGRRTTCATGASRSCTCTYPVGTDRRIRRAAQPLCDGGHLHPCPHRRDRGRLRSTAHVSEEAKRALIEKIATLAGPARRYESELMDYISESPPDDPDLGKLSVLARELSRFAAAIPFHPNDFPAVVMDPLEQLRSMPDEEE